MRRHLPRSLGTRDDDPLAVFVRGATVGAFVGAMIAGSTIWRRIRRPGPSGPTAPAPTSGDPAPPMEEAGQHSS